MQTNKELEKARQTMNRAHRQFSLAQEKERKADVRNKIELGGLIIKSGLAVEPKAVILGALIDSLEQIHRDPEARKIFKMKGEASFMNFVD